MRGTITNLAVIAGLFVLAFLTTVGLGIMVTADGSGAPKPEPREFRIDLPDDASLTIRRFRNRDGQTVECAVVTSDSGRSGRAVALSCDWP